MISNHSYSFENQAKNEKTNTNENIQNGSCYLTLRSIVTTKEAGIIIGKEGASIAEIRESNKVKAGVSKKINNVPIRVLTIGGKKHNVYKAYRQILDTFNSNTVNDSNQGSIRLLVQHNLMGCIIGRSGIKIKKIQEESNCKITANKETLPNSTERIIEVFGDFDSIKICVGLIINCITSDTNENSNKPTNFMLYYNPASGFDLSLNSEYPKYKRKESPLQGSNKKEDLNDVTSNSSKSKIITNEICIPNELVGFIIGRGGCKISEIRRKSESKITIVPKRDNPNNQEQEAGRLFSFSGTDSENRKALVLIYNMLANERYRLTKDTEYNCNNFPQIQNL